MTNILETSESARHYKQANIANALLPIAQETAYASLNINRDIDKANPLPIAGECQ